MNFRNPRTHRHHFTKLAIAFCLPIPANAIFIQLDYTFDTGNYFAPASAERARLEDAAGFYENLLVDDLDAITPTGTYGTFTPESWQVNFSHPSTGATQTVDDLAVAADTVIIYVGARTYSGGQLASGGFGGANTFAFGGSTFDTATKTRGESGVGTTDFAPWGGFLSIDDGTTWDTSLAGSGSNYHLYSTLVHEVGHVLGLGTADSWHAQRTGSNFTGTESVSVHGGNVPLHLSSGSGMYDHWAEGTTSDIYGTTTSQEAALDPTIPSGVVKLLTKLDVAGLDDIGWDISTIPEPSQLALALSGLALLLRRRR